MSQTKIFTLIFISLFVFAFTFQKSNDEKPHQKSTTINQFSVIGALINGDYIGDISYKEIKSKGNFGLGTFNCLNGEMVALDGNFYQIKSDGKVSLVSDSLLSPFASVHNFVADSCFSINSEINNFDELKKDLSQLITNPKNIYAFKIHAEFNSIDFRSVPKQAEPFPNLADALKNQVVFNLKNAKGTLVGYWFPEYLKEINATGFHLHFISDDKNHGGHMLNCSFKNANIEADYLSNLSLIIPQNKEFQIK